MTIVGWSLRLYCRWPRALRVRARRVRLYTSHAAAALAALTAGASSAYAAGPGADAALVARGEYLAKAGDCVACHSAPRGKPFAGGLPMTTPMGRIYSTNITPDPDTGIGRYTEADFARAVREGVAPDGRALYPAMPYPSYAKISDVDMKALYAYFMHGVTPVKQANRATDIPWPLNMRWPLKLWNVVFLDSTRYRPKMDKDAQWNRGAYLVQGLGHCGACHTPRGFAFQEQALDESGRAFLTGAPLENWFASNLTGNHNTGLGRWSEDDLNTFLRTGANAHATAFGSMTDVINNSTQMLSDADTRAIARYIKSLPGGRDNDGSPYMRHPDGEKMMLTALPGKPGAHTYATYCMHCHGAGGRGAAPWLAPLAGNPNVLEPDPVSLINVTLNGTGPLVIGGVPAPYPMPTYHQILTDQQIADVLTFVRNNWNNQAPAVSAQAVAKVRHATRAP
ncbi:cytochrome c [Paraburkholderia rhizosphaerae]|uniref:Mono/diheme cytochrome c family protein n=1 Tax=Paraburkholderia rhizosphaerae TaxID=480658 RepID=A0A4R8LUU8_9BURK|nr:cytochrome c [Paraburkholderia rhizosphaerae]TDY51549.1 mono/diheme cytochrome c family protein [Paraburkholderia rhizosphaerae]